MCGKAALVLCFAAVAIWTSDILDDEFHDETASHHQLELALKEEQDVPRFSSSIGFLRRLSLPGNAQLSKEVVAKSGRRNVQETPVPARVLSSDWTPLHEAAEDGDVSEVKQLLAKGAEVNAKTSDGYTPLHTAAMFGHLDVMKALIAKGAEVDAKTEDGETPLHQAARWGNLDVVKELLYKGAEVDAKDKYGSWTPLHLAAKNGHLDVVKELLYKGAEVDAKDKNGETPLHKVHGHVEVVKVLLSNGAAVNAKDADGQTPLHLAASKSHLDVVKELLAAKEVEVNTKDKYGETPLHVAADYGHVEVAKVLLANGADMNAKSNGKYGTTPLDLAPQALGHQVIKLAQRAKKWNESKEALKMLTDALQARCLPEVAQWAVNHSYAIDDFPGDASTARSCVLQYMNFPTRARRALGSKWSYVFPGAGVAIAAASVYLVEPRILRHFGSVDASHHEETHKFDRGAHLLVGKAAVKCYWRKVAFRFFEVITIIAFFMGFAMVELWWVLWLPLVGLLFLLPGIKLYGSTELIRTPVLCIASTNTWKGYMWSFLRLVLIFGAYQGVEATTGWHRREARPWDFSSLKMEVFVNPMYEGLQSKMKNMWKTSAIETYDTCQAVLFESLFAYACSLLVRMWHQCCEDGDFPDINYVSYAKRLAECPTEDVPGLIEKIKQKEPDLQVEPMGTWSLIKMLIFVALDVFFDVNTIITLILSSNLRFACALTFVVARSAFREWNNFSGLKEAVWESSERGMLHEQLIDLLEEEKGAEAFFSLSITSYSYVYCVQTGKQAVVQWLSILSAAYGIAEFLVQKMEFPTTEFPATEKVNSFVIVPSEEIQKEKGDA